MLFIIHFFSRYFLVLHLTLTLSMNSRAYVQYHIVPSQNILLEKYVGKMTVGLIKKASLKIWSDPNFHPKIKSFIDLRQCDIKLSVLDIIKLSTFYLKHGSNNKGFVMLLADSNTH